MDQFFKSGPTALIDALRKMETVARSNWPDWLAASHDQAPFVQSLGYFQFFLRPSNSLPNYNLHQMEIMLSIEFDALYRKLQGKPLTPLAVHFNWAVEDADIDSQREKLSELFPLVFVSLDRSRIFNRGEPYHKELIAWQYASLIKKEALVLSDVRIKLDRYHPDFENPPREPAYVLQNMCYNMDDIGEPLKTPRYSDCAMVPILLAFLPVLRTYHVDPSHVGSLLDWLIDGASAPPLGDRVLREIQQAFTKYTPVGQLKSQNRLELEITKKVSSTLAPQCAPVSFRRINQASPKHALVIDNWEAWCGDTLRLALASKDISNWAPLAVAKRIRRFAQSVTSATTSTVNRNAVLNTYVEWSLNQLIAKVTRAYELGDYDNAIIEVMSSTRKLSQFSNLPPELVRRHKAIHLVLASPIIPFTCEYLWQELNFPGLVLSQAWPTPSFLNPKAEVVGTLTHHAISRGRTLPDRSSSLDRCGLLSEKGLPAILEAPGVKTWLNTRWSPRTHALFPDWVKQEVVFILWILSRTPIPMENVEVLERIVGAVVDFDLHSWVKTADNVVRALNQSKLKHAAPASPAQLRIHNYYPAYAKEVDFAH